jgi:hypothetical protein
MASWWYRSKSYGTLYFIQVGMDASAAFKELHSVKAYSVLAKYKVGILEHLMVKSGFETGIGEIHQYIKSNKLNEPTWYFASSVACHIFALVILVYFNINIVVLYHFEKYFNTCNYGFCRDHGSCVATICVVCA